MAGLSAEEVTATPPVTTATTTVEPAAGPAAAGSAAEGAAGAGEPEAEPAGTAAKGVDEVEPAEVEPLGAKADGDEVDGNLRTAGQARRHRLITMAALAPAVAAVRAAVRRGLADVSPVTRCWWPAPAAPTRLRSPWRPGSVTQRMRTHCGLVTVDPHGLQSGSGDRAAGSPGWPGTATRTRWTCGPSRSAATEAAAGGVRP